MRLPALAPLLPFVLVGACSSASNSPASPPADTGAGPSDAGDAVASDDGLDGAGDVATEAEAPPSYADAVLAALWQELPKGPKVTSGAKQDDIWFSSPKRGFAVSGPLSAIFSTDDGGDTWTKVFSHKGTHFRSLAFTDDNHGFASNLGPIDGTSITDATLLYETKDGGGAWAPVTAIAGPMPTGICNQTKIDATHLIAVGRVNGPCFLMSSSDAGASWTSISLDSKLSMLIDARFTTPKDGIVVGGTNDASMKCTILHTGDGGATWETVFTSKTPASLCWKISFPTDAVGYVSVQDNGVGPATFAKTIDGGKTWVEKPVGLKAAYSGIGIGFITENIGWISSENPKQETYRTSDGGETWEVDPALKSPINRFRFVDKATAYAIGGSVWKLSIATTP